jgi:hypothetical protein
MATHYSPIIRSEDYEAFRNLINADMPGTFDAWAYERAEADLQHTRRGLTVLSIEVNPDGFERYLRDHRAKASRHELDNFAFYEATRLDRDKK